MGTLPHWRLSFLDKAQATELYALIDITSKGCLPMRPSRVFLLGEQPVQNLVSHGSALDRFVRRHQRWVSTNAVARHKNATSRRNVGSYW